MAIRDKLADALLKHGNIDTDDFGIYTCIDCPFEAPTVEPYHEISNDFSEAHYLCPVSRTIKWGERPDCGAELMRVALGLKEALPAFSGDRHAGIPQSPGQDGQSNLP